MKVAPKGRSGQRTLGPCSLVSSLRNISLRAQEHFPQGIRETLEVDLNILCEKENELRKEGRVLELISLD